MLTRVRRWFGSPLEELEPKEAYRLWAEDYPPYAHNVLMEAEERAVCERLPEVQGKRAVDVACGTGRYVQLLQARGAEAVGLDFSYEMLDHAQHPFGRVNADMRALPLRDGCADVMVCGMAVGHVAELEGALREMGRVLTRHGVLVYSDFHPAGSAKGWKRTFRAANKTYAVQHYTRTELEHADAVAAAGLQVTGMHDALITAEMARADPRAETFRAQWGDTPVALIVQARKL